MPTTTFEYTTPSNYTYDSDKIEISGGVAKLKQQVFPTDYTCFATYTTTINLNKSANGGVLTGTAVGGAAISGNKLDLAHNDLRYVTYAALNNISQITQIGAIKLKYTPNYNTKPTSTRNFFTICQSAGNLNHMFLYHRNTDGHLIYYAYDSVGSLIGVIDFGNWVATLGTTYEFELNFDFTTGATRLFINGVQLGATMTDTGTRTSAVDLLIIGSNQAASFNSDQSYEDIILFSTVQHTANYTPGYALYETDYDINDPTVLTNSGINTDGINSVSHVISVSGSDLVKHVLRYDSTDYYWTGSAWAVSNGTYAQSNTITEINDNVASLSLIEGKVVYIKSFLHSNDGGTYPELDSFTITYCYQGPAPGETAKCTIEGFVRDHLGDPIVGVEVRVYIQNYREITGKNLIIAPTKTELTTDTTGQWSVCVIRSSEYNPSAKYIVEIGSTSYEITVPDQEVANFTDLI